MPYAVYILRCSDGTGYTGLAKDLDYRVWEHQTGANPDSYTFRRRPVKLERSVVTESYQQAFQWEHRIKGWSRAKKEALIRGDIEGIHEIVRTERKQRHKIKRNPRAECLANEARLTREIKVPSNLRFVCGIIIPPLSAIKHI